MLTKVLPYNDGIAVANSVCPLPDGSGLEGRGLLKQVPCTR